MCSWYIFLLFFYPVFIVAGVRRFTRTDKSRSCQCSGAPVCGGCRLEGVGAQVVADHYPVWDGDRFVQQPVPGFVRLTSALPGLTIPTVGNHQPVSGIVISPWRHPPPSQFFYIRTPRHDLAPALQTSFCVGIMGAHPQIKPHGSGRGRSVASITLLPSLSDFTHSNTLG